MAKFEQFQQTQQEKLHTMETRQHKLHQHWQEEQVRLQTLSDHLQKLEHNHQMDSSLGLQNLSQVKQQFTDMCQQQQHKLTEAEQQWQRQRLACLEQAKYNKGLDHLIEKRMQRSSEKVRRQEARQTDEMTLQAFLRRQGS